MTTKTTKKAAPKTAAKSTPKKAPVKAAPKAKAPARPEAPATVAPAPAPRDPRLPAVGTTLTRTFNGKDYEVEILDDGFRHDGKTWRSLSAIAKAISGTSWNGFLFWNLQTRAKAPAAQKDGAK
jgi:hypothetical protein